MKLLFRIGIVQMALAAATPAFCQVLQIQPQTITFPSSDPDTVPVVAAAPVQVSFVRGSGRGGSGSWSITVRADGDLTAGPAQIPIASITWVAAPSPPFRDGTLSSTVAQTLASGLGSEPNTRGSVTFRLANSWNYSAGTYTQTIVFTLTSP